MYMGEDDEDTAPLGYDDDNDDGDVDVEDWREEDWDVDEDEDWDEDGPDDDEQEILQESQWSLPTNLRQDEDDLLP